MRIRWPWENSAHGHILDQLDCIEGKVDSLLATLQELTDQIARIDANVTAGNEDIATIQAQIEDLKGQVGGGGLTEAEEAEIAAQLTALEGRIAEQAAALDSSADETAPD